MKIKTKKEGDIEIKRIEDERYKKVKELKVLEKLSEEEKNAL